MRPGWVKVRLGARQQRYVRDALSDVDEIEQVASEWKGNVAWMPVTAAGTAASRIMAANTTWDGRSQSQHRARLTQILADIVVTYARHPAFSDPPRALEGLHHVVLPAWDDGATRSWWPRPGDRIVLVPSWDSWGRTAMTTWRPGQASEVVDVDHELLEAFAVTRDRRADRTAS